MSELSSFSDALRTTVQPKLEETKSTLGWNNKILASLLGLLIGTGGVANANTLRTPLPVSSTVIVTVCGEHEHRRFVREELSVEEQLAAIQRNLSLNVSELSNALAVTRPTIYAWLRAEKEPQPENLARIQQVYRIARFWRSMSAHPVGNLRNAIQESTGRSLIGELSASHLDENALRSTLTTLRAAAPDVLRRRSIADVARDHGLTTVERPTKWSEESDL